MRNFQHENEKRIYSIISMVKLSSLLFCAIIMYNYVFYNTDINISKNGYANTFFVSAVFILIALVYFIWLFFSTNKFQVKNSNLVQIVENLVFMGMFTFLIIISGKYNSQYKFLYLFIIITSTIQMGLKCGVMTSVISSVIILSIDLFYFSNSNINIYFENDLILVGVFILTAVPLGYYVKFENENLKQKNMQLKELNKELNVRDKERKYIEEMLFRNDTCYSLLIENARDAILIHRDKVIVFANESAAKLLGYGNSNMLMERHIYDIIPLEEQEREEKKLNQLYNNKIDALCFETTIKDNKQKISIQNTCTSIIYKNEPAVLSILHDITSEKQVVELKKDVEKNIELLNESREYNKLITEFLANISHELKTPLNVIFIAVQTLELYGEDVNMSNRKEQYIKVIKQNCYRLMRLINNLLDTTKVDSGYLKLSLVNCDIVNLIEDITLSVVYYAESKDINIIFDTDTEEKVMAVDPDKIERIVLNLLSNAIKFTDNGGKIYVNIKDNEDNIIISVKDTGMGIPEDKIKTVFDRFVQVDKTLTRGKEGSGIGLYLVKSFVEMHKGNIEIKSKLNEGSEFIINMPVKLLESEEENIKNILYSPNKEYVNMEFSDIYSDM